MQALTQGCRCIKIDLVLDETNNFIVGGTLPLQEVLDTIRDFAFAGSFSLSAYRLINYHIIFHKHTAYHTIFYK